MHKDTILGIITNTGKSRLIKVIFANIRKMSDACTNSFGRYIMIVQRMRNVFTFNEIQVFFRENGVSKKIKAHFVQNPPPLQQLFSPHLFNFIQKKLASLPFKVEGAESMYSISI